MPNIHINDIRNNKIEYDRYLIVFLLSQYIPKGTSYYLINHDKLSVLLDRIKSNSRYKKHAVMLKISHVSNYYVALYINGNDAWYNDPTGSPINDNIERDLKNKNISVRDLKINLVKFRNLNINIVYRRFVLERSVDSASDTKYTNTAVYSVYVLKCLANDDDIENTQTAGRLRQSHYETAYNYWLRHNRNITTIVKKGFIPKEHKKRHKIIKGLHKGYSGVRNFLKQSHNNEFQTYRKILNQNGVQLHIIIKQGDIYDMNADVIVNLASVDCIPVLSWVGTSATIRDHIAYNKNDYKILVYDWENNWCQSSSNNKGRVSFVHDKSNNIHRFHSYKHPPYFLIHLGSISLYNKWIHSKVVRRYLGEEKMDIPEYLMFIESYKRIFEMIEQLNAVNTQPIKSVAIPPLNLGTYAIRGGNIGNIIYEAIRQHRRHISHELHVYIPIKNIHDKTMDILVHNLKYQLDRIV